MLNLSHKQRQWIRRIDQAGRLLAMGKPRPLPAAADVHKILVVELWGIGDVVLATSALQGLRIHFPKAKIILLAQEHARCVLQQSAWVDEIIAVKMPWTAQKHKYRWWRYPWRKLIKLFGYLRRERIDLALDARIDIRNNLLLWFSGARHRLAYADAGGGFFLTRPLCQPSHLHHRVEMWGYILEQLGYTQRTPPPRLCLSDSEKSAAALWLKNQGVPGHRLLAGIHPGAAHPLRRWAVKNFLEVAVMIKQQFDVQWLIFGETGLAEADWLARNIAGARRVEGDLRFFLSVAEPCDLLLMNDSGPMHMIAALNRPLVAIFGPGRPDWFSPRNSNSRVILKAGVECRGCHDRCVHPQPHCMDVPVDAVAEAALKLLRRARGKHESS